MSPPAIAAVWLTAGVVGAAALPRFRLRRLAPLVPLLGLAALLLATVVPAVAVPTADSGLSLQLDRTAQGLLAASAAATVLFLLRSGRVRGPELTVLGVGGAGAVVMLSATQPLLWAEAPLIVVAAIALRWIAVAPGRPALAAGRAGITGAAALLAAAPFLPLAAVQSDPRPALVGALLGVGLAAVLGILPMGGWTQAGMAALPAAETLAWSLLLAPALLLALDRVPGGIPEPAASVFGHILLAAGLGSAAWQGLQAARGAGPRYARVLLADVALAAAAVGSVQAGVALVAIFAVVLTHFSAGPLLLDEAHLPGRLRPLAWALLCGLPPAPSFWARFLVLESLAGVGGVALLVGVAAAGALTVASFLAMRVPRAAPEAAARQSRFHAWTTWTVSLALLAAGLLAGVAPQLVSRFVFGVQ
jgi:hypothetical protein